MQKAEKKIGQICRPKSRKKIGQICIIRQANDTKTAKFDTKNGKLIN